MSGRTGSTILRRLPLRSPNSSTLQASSLFRLSPSSSTRNLSEISTGALSRRSYSSALRLQTHHTILRAALACESSSLRYALLLSGEGEGALLRGWDDGAVLEDDDGV
ncbi:hypothetical protein ACHAWF_015976 [Thalassiosira exigua]